ncbi:MAG: ketoacyl-ACP synthase III [Flavobacteriales bacterium]|nr:ketoacyl-ACP synthase III [Flavobacteriales bacterium]MDW8432070.1 beta-ketoacyl-ACP synthase III [Flavobacteriales bacterium]
MFLSKIVGMGMYLPENVVTNQDLEKLMDTTDAWIVERTGIHQRRFFTEGKDTTASMATEASRMALERAGMRPSQLDAIVFATLSPDYYFPGCAPLVMRDLGISGIAALDIRAQCGGFIYALSVADQYIRTGMYKNVLVACSEIQSNILELSTRGRNMAVIFGDGAASVVLTRHEEQGKGVLSTHLHADGTYAEELYMPHPGSRRKVRLTPEMLEDGSMLPYMNGNAVFKHAVVRFMEVIYEALEAHNFSVQDLDLVIPHQANLRISNYIQQQLGLPDEKIYNNIQWVGNTTAASIPLAMCEAWEKGILKPGMLLCTPAFGSGFVWGSALIRM